MTNVTRSSIEDRAVDWPSAALEKVDCCPVCSGEDAVCVYDRLEDLSFFTAKGTWRLFRCNSCGTFYLNPRPNLLNIGDAYGEYYTHKEATPNPQRDLQGIGPKVVLRRFLHSHIRNRFGARKNAPRVERILEEMLFWPIRRRLEREFRHLPGFDGKAPRRLLDVGCGNGEFLAKAQKIGWKVEGIDIDSKAVTAAKSKQLNVRAGGFELYKEVDAPFDVITASHVIEHVHHPDRFLDDCYRLLNPGGVMWLETPNVESEGHRVFGRDWRGLEVPRHLVMFNARSLQTLLQRSGFTQISFLKSPNPIKGMYQASIAMKKGQPQDSLPELDLNQTLTYWQSRMRNRLNPQASEFLTVQAIKPQFTKA